MLASPSPEVRMEPVTTLVELLERSRVAYAERPFIGTRRSGAWQWISYAGFGELVDHARAGLAGLGVGAGDRVAFIGDNSVEWAAAAHATYGLGAAFVPMYQAQRPSEWQFILGDCGARVAVVATDPTLAAVEAMRLPELAHVVGVAGGGWERLLADGAAHPVPAASPHPGSVAAFIYTSGTTGKPKGALLSHRNITSNLVAMHQVITISPEDRYLSFLPWAHVFGQTVELHGILSYGASMALNDELPRLLDNLAEVKPTVLVAVPRIFNRIYDAVIREVPAGLIDKILARAPEVAPVTEKIRGKFGGRLRYAFSGSATLSRKVAELIDALGITVYEGYGLTETSPIVTTNSPLGRRFGSVGRPLPGVRVVIDSDGPEGEIVVYGPNVMLGYHRRPAENQAALRPDGGLRTGDLGRLDEDGFLYITGRIKEQYKLETGKYVMPSPLEEALKLSPFIANIVVYGDDRPFNVALVVPSEPAIRAWAEAAGMVLGADLTTDHRVRDLVAGEIERLSVEFKGYEKPRDFALVREDFTVDNGLLTPTLKLKRREVVARHGRILDELYARLGADAAPPAA
jgi:long-chain acyl-CoA synthetase